ncbi:MAG: hypothetical protein IPM58_12275 [Nitrospira sp.]|nr:hypothetical protein [Nitrospira sp.]
MWKKTLLVVGAIGLLSVPFNVAVAKPELNGKFEILKDEASTHQSGKVKIIEFGLTSIVPLPSLKRRGHASPKGIR